MTGLLLRLAGPFQSWGERSPFAERDTAPFPTRSAMIGMFAAAEGRRRGEDLHPYEHLEFTVRVDRPGLPMVDFHTAGGGEPAEFTAATSGGKHKGAAVVTKRTYLADAVFVVAVSGPDDEIDRIATALDKPYWSPYLGRRSCPPDEPFVLRAAVSDPVGELRHRVPLSPSANMPRRPTGQDQIPVDFYWENYPFDPLPDDATEISVLDIPLSFAPHGRSHGKRHLHRTVEPLPFTLLRDQDTLHQALVDYALDIQGDQA